MPKDYLNHLKETQEIIDECEGESDSILCSNCPCTDYGMEKNYSHSPWGYSSCEGSHCEEAIDNVEDNLKDEYKLRKGELKMGDAKMNVEIDLSTLEQNLLKMSMDEIGNEVISTLVNNAMEKIDKEYSDKLNEMIEDKVNSITKDDIYKIEVNLDGQKINLFDLMVRRMANEALNKSLAFSDKVNEMIDSVKYEPISGEYKDDEFKVLTTYKEDEDGNTDSMVITINGKDIFGISEGEPEDMTFNRDLNDIFSIPQLIEKAYLAGKNGKIMYQATSNEVEE